MQSLAFQTSNILANLYTDGIMTYITTPTITNIPHQFHTISTYCNTYIPTWNQVIMTLVSYRFNQDFYLN